MKTLLAATVGSLAVTLFCVVALDDWSGILAFRFRYLVFSLVAASTVGLFWLVRSWRATLAVGLASFGLLVSPYFVTNPSSRILREVLIDVEAGASVADVERIVHDAYDDSGHAQPIIDQDDDRLNISLRSQGDGISTGAIFQLEDGRVVSSTFAPD